MVVLLVHHQRLLTVVLPLRLKKLLEQEKVYQASRDKDHHRTLEKVRAELVKLRSFALMLVEEHQLHTEQIDQQNQKIQDLSQRLQEKEQSLAASSAGAREDAQNILRLETELEQRAAVSAQELKDMSSKLSSEESQSRQLRLRVKGMSSKLEELEEHNRLLHQSQEDLQELRQKISKGECGNATLMAELEKLRKKVLEMEGKDEEITKTENQCRELRKKLQEEENHGKELKLEVDKLRKRMVDLEKLEVSFGRSKSECSQLQTNLEKEKHAVKELAGELEKVKKQMKDLLSSESKLEQAEMILKDDLVKLKSFTVLLVEERKNMEERLKQEEQKNEALSQMFKVEQGKVTEVTEKLIDESKKLLKFKSEMEDKVAGLVKEREELKSKLAGEEAKSQDLKVKVNSMKLRIDGLEETEKELQKKCVKEKSPDQEQKVKELTLEIDRLKNRLEHLEVVEGDLMKTEDEYDLLEKKFRTEQDKANALARTLEEVRSQIARNKAIEKGEVKSLEAELRTRLQLEEAKRRELQGDVQALKEKVHELMTKEDQLSQLQVDFSVLQRRFLEEEGRNRTMSQELCGLTLELEAARRCGRSLRPSPWGGRMLSVAVASTAVQTDAAAPDDDTAAGFIRKSVQEEHHLMSNLRQQQGLKAPPPPLDRYAPPELRTGKSWIPCVRRTSPGNAPFLGPPPAKHGHPLRIRVTPDHGKTTATLEITSPGAEDFFSSTTIIPTLGSQSPRITIVPKAPPGAAGGGPRPGQVSGHHHHHLQDQVSGGGGPAPPSGVHHHRQQRPRGRGLRPPRPPAPPRGVLQEARQQHRDHGRQQDPHPPGGPAGRPPPAAAVSEASSNQGRFHGNSCPADAQAGGGEDGPARPREDDEQHHHHAGQLRPPQALTASGESCTRIRHAINMEASGWLRPDQGLCL